MKLQSSLGALVAMLFVLSDVSSSIAVAAVPSPWSFEDVGAVGAAGSADLAGGTFTISASGADIWTTADEFGFVHQSFAGDGEIIARVSSLTNTHEWAKAGVMIRSSTAAGSTHVGVVVTPGQGVSLQRRPEPGGTSISVKVAGIVAPQWVKLVRRGHMFTGYYGSDGVNWTQLGNSVRVPVSRNAKAGLAVTSHNDGTLTTAVIDSVTLKPGVFPRLLFIRGGAGTGGFLEGGADDQLAELGDFSTAGGNHGWGELAEVLIGAGYSLDAMIEGPVAANTPVDLTAFDLSDYEAIVFGSNNADYTVAQINVLEDYVRGGGGALFISDANFGGSWADAPNSDQLFLNRFGLVVNQDQGTYSLVRSSGDFTTPTHPILAGIDRFDGEGVSPFVLGVLSKPVGATITKLAVAKNNTRNNNVSPGQGTSRSVTTADASLVAVELDYGRVIGHFDRNTFFNLNGAGTSIQRFDNTQFALNLFGWLSGQIEPLTRYQGWAQSHFAELPGGRSNSLAASGADPDFDQLDNDTEFALGTDPNDSTDRNGGITATVTAEAGQSLITLAFLRRNDDPSLSTEPELSENLGVWQSGVTVFQTISIIDQGNGYEQVVVKTLAATLARPTAFVRLRVTRSSP